MISNMFHCLKLISSQKIEQYPLKLFWVFSALHSLSIRTFDVFLLLQPIEFKAVVQVNTFCLIMKEFISCEKLMDEALRINFEEREVLNFFVCLLNCLFEA